MAGKYVDEDGYYRLWDIIGCKMRQIKPLIPVGKTKWWNGIQTGFFPAGIKLGRRTTVWRKKDIHYWIASH